MPTRDRRKFVGQAIWYFLRQDYPDRELIVVDDGVDPVADLIPNDSRIRYVRLKERRTIGAKRNIACELSDGDLIAHWDDDDWIAPHRLSLQVRELTSSGASACGSRALLHYFIDAAQAWLYRSSPADVSWLAGGTLMYRRSAWEAKPFREIDIGEDSSWVREIPAERLRAIDGDPYYIALVHSANTASKNVRDRRWEQLPLDDVRSILAHDRDFYAALRNSGKRSGGRAPSSLTVRAQFLIYDGYGSMAEYLVRGMAREGATVNISPITLDVRGFGNDFTRLLERSRPEPGAPLLYFSPLSPGGDPFRAERELFINTMWESSRLPKNWPSQMNGARTIIVPTRYVADVCRKSGVTAPIEVVAQGCDPEVYSYIERPDRPGLTTLIVGTIVGRKHVREGIAAWKRAFEGDREARLIIKSRFRYGNFTPDDPRIIFVDDNETTRGIPHWYAEADLLMALGNEGFGLPLVEGMATGLPVIALGTEGQGDLCEDAAGLLLPVPAGRMERYDEPPYGSCGFRGVPDVDAVVERLRWVKEHRDEAREMGRQASEWALRERNIWRMGPAMLDVIEANLAPPRPLRRRPFLWVPSMGTPCGIAEYTEYLAAALPNVTVTSTFPEARRTRLLHVQHHDGIFNERELSRQIRIAKHAGTKVAVTEHAVGPAARAWEADADLLISLTKSGADALRHRWPGRRVEYIPHGCPTWFPRRKRRPGRTIGAFGFIEQHKGFRQLLELLRSVPETELLLFGHAKTSERDREWEEESRGLPVRRVAEFLPIEEIARRLAAEADILAFWYDDTDLHTTSGAIRVAMATGVPVLASPTRWFTDVREATYQPEILIEGVERLLGDIDLQREVTAAAHDYCNAHSWIRTAELHRELWRSLE